MSGIAEVFFLNKRGQAIQTIKFPIEELSQVCSLEIRTRRGSCVCVYVFEKPEDGFQVTAVAPKYVEVNKKHQMHVPEAKG